MSRSKREEIAAEVYEDEVDLRRSGSYFNNSLCSVYSDHSLDPDDIRVKSPPLSHAINLHSQQNPPKEVKDTVP